MKKLLLLVLVTLVTIVSLDAQFDYDFLERKTQESDLAIIGKVVEKESFWNSKKTMIFTSNKINVLGKIKGETPDVIEIITYGGDIEDKFQIWSDERTLSSNSKGYFFLKEDKSGFAKSEHYYILNGERSFIPLPKKQTPDITPNNFVSTDKIIEFGFDNIQVQQVNELSFDILVKTNSAGVGLEFGYGDVLAHYSAEVFGFNVYDNDKLGVVKEVVLADPAYSLVTEDFAADVFRSIINGGCNSSSTAFTTGVPLTTEFQKLLAVTMEIEDLTALGTISLDEFQMNGNVNYYDPQTGNCLPFDSIIYPNPIETGMVCNITGFMSDLDAANPDRTAAGTDNILTITGMNFEGMPGAVEFQNADEPGGALVTTEAVDFDAAAGGSWADNQIQVKVPSAPITAGSGIFQIRTASGMVCISPAPLEICYAATTFRTGANEVRKIYLADHLDDGDGQFPFRLDAGLDGNADAVASIEMSICDWNAQTNIDWNIGAVYGGASPSIDGENHIFLAPAGVFATNPGASMRTIIGGNRILTCNDFSEIPPINLNHTTDIDLAVRQDLNTMNPPAPGGWNFDPVAMPAADQLDFYSIMQHELGHAHLLGHALSDNKKMYPNSMLGDDMRNIIDKDALGGNYILDLSDAALNAPDAVCPTPVERNVMCAVSVEELQEISNLVIAPNPFSDKINLSLSLEDSYEVQAQLYDLRGQTIAFTNFGKLNSGEHQLTMSFDSSLSTGVYFLAVEINGISGVYKMIKL